MFSVNTEPVQRATKRFSEDKKISEVHQFAGIDIIDWVGFAEGPCKSEAVGEIDISVTIEISARVGEDDDTHCCNIKADRRADRVVAEEGEDSRDGSSCKRATSAPQVSEKD